MSKLSTTLTVKNGSTTYAVNLYSSTSDMSDSTYTNEYLTCKANGSTAYIAVASSGTTAYNTYGTALKYKNSSGVDKYILTEPYFDPYTPSYTGTITIPTMTFYENTNKSDYYDDNKYNNFWTSSKFYCNSGDKVVIKATNGAFRLKEGTSMMSQGDTNIPYSTYMAYISVEPNATSTHTNFAWSSEVCDTTHDGDENAGGYFYANVPETTINITSAGNYYVHVIYGSVQLRYKALADLCKTISVQVN